MGIAPLEHPTALEEAKGWTGNKLDDASGSTAGRVEGVFVDSRSGEPTWLVIRIGVLGRRSAVPYELAAGGVGRVWVPLPRELVRSAPEVDPEAGLDPVQEADLYNHFGVPAEVGRAAVVAEREPGPPSSVPA